MTELVSETFKYLKDPALVLAVLVIGGLFYLLLKNEKNIKELHACIDTNMSECNETITKLVTLVEVLVYGRNRNGNP